MTTTRVTTIRLEEIKASIRERTGCSTGDHARRPGEEHFIIQNGGNAIGHPFASCGPRPSRNASSPPACSALAGTGRDRRLDRPRQKRAARRPDLHRARLGVEKAREFYEQETGGTLAV